MGLGGSERDGLDHAVAFLKQRDGLDKMLKLMRYAAQLSAHHVLLRDPTSVTGAKLRNLDASTSVTRKFIRLGKFLGNAKELRVLLHANVAIVSASNSSSRDANDGARSSSSSGGSTAAVAASAAARLGHAALLTNRLGIACQSVQLLYNFLEQGNWAVKTGLIRNARRKEAIGRWANWTELLTYVFSVQLAYLELRECARFVEEVESELRLRNRNKKHDGDGDGDGGDARVGGGEAGEEGGKGVEGAVHAEARHRETMREG
eukprot:CAMPEP_0181349086 /NCGR_PEP_ID=MMETSP1106-20121128/535_1 /TAXON_ID=81844 /ORGANISM="Mantoniella antarctica, Strain SL-175" /LENGTH=261 /DNA_ID=CAMNT_0023461449 /DNA_START=243 /DNA_END=1024 /DNA_ORIENTATION=+